VSDVTWATRFDQQTTRRSQALQGTLRRGAPRGERAGISSTPAAALVGLVNVATSLKGGGLAARQTTSWNGWRTTSKGKSKSTAVVVAHIPLWTVVSAMGAGDRDAGGPRARNTSRVWLGTVTQPATSTGDAEVEATSPSTPRARPAFPQRTRAPPPRPDR